MGKITGALLKTHFTAYSALFQEGLGMAAPEYMDVATVVPSSTKSQEFGWLGKSHNMRKWLGDRVVNTMRDHSYTITNEDFELTEAVDRNDIEDDNLGQYAPLMRQMGQSVAAHPNQLVFDLLKRGFEEKCYDGQNFFDTDHPVLDADGNAQSVSNMQDGAGEPWFLVDTNRVLLPIIFQERKKPDFVALDDPTDENVFMRRQFLYGIHGRYNVGFGFWQFAFGSKAPLTAANYQAARVALQEMKGDYGRPLGNRPSKLFCAPAQEGAALKILNNALTDGGATNEWAGTAEVCATPWLA